MRPRPTARARDRARDRGRLQAAPWPRGRRLRAQVVSMIVSFIIVLLAITIMTILTIAVTVISQTPTRSGGRGAGGVRDLL